MNIIYYNQCNTIDSTTESTTCVNARQTLVTEDYSALPTNVLIAYRVLIVNGAIFCLLVYSCSAMDRPIQHSVFHTIAFLAFSCHAFSTPATWCRIFMSRNFYPCKLVPQIHVSHFPPLQHGAAFSCPASSCLAFSASP